MAKPQLRKPKKKIGPVKAIKVGTIDYKDTATLRKFISDRGKIRAHIPSFFFFVICPTIHQLFLIICIGPQFFTLALRILFNDRMGCR